MSDTVVDETKVVEKPTRTAPVFERILAISMKPPLFDDDPDGVSYTLVYVNPQGKQCKVDCTENVWRDVQQSKLTRKPRHDFVLLRDKEADIVTQIQMHLKRDFNLFDQVEDSSESSGSRQIEAVVDTEGLVSIRNRPADVTQMVEDVILSSLKQDPEVKSGDYISGQYRVDEVRERDGYRTVYINPARQ